MNGVIVIFYRDRNDQREFLVVENAKTGNISFVSGGQEGEESLIETAQREIKEELDLNPIDYELVATDVVHEFIFGSNKPDREGQKGMYRVFLSDGTSLGDISYTDEITSISWKLKEDVLEEISFDDLKDVFIKIIN